jgi:hypothetical protein
MNNKLYNNYYTYLSLNELDKSLQEHFTIELKCLLENNLFEKLNDILHEETPILLFGLPNDLV